MPIGRRERCRCAARASGERRSVSRQLILRLVPHLVKGDLAAATSPDGSSSGRVATRFDGSSVAASRPTVRATSRARVRRRSAVEIPSRSSLGCLMSPAAVAWLSAVVKSCSGQWEDQHSCLMSVSVRTWLRVGCGRSPVILRRLGYEAAVSALSLTRGVRSRACPPTRRGAVWSVRRRGRRGRCVRGLSVRWGSEREPRVRLGQGSGRRGV